MKTTFKKILDALRITGFDFIDHAIGAILLFTMGMAFFDIIFVSEAAICVNLFFCCFAVAGLEIWQGKTNNGTMQVSDMMSGILTIFVCIPFCNGVYTAFGKAIFPGFTLLEPFYALIIAAACFYPFVWRQLPESEKKRFIKLFKGEK